MPRQYKNPNPYSIIEEIIVPDDAGYSGYFHPHVKLREESLNREELLFEALPENKFCHVVKNKHEHFGNFVSTLESLEQHGLIDPLFKENILKDEKRLYQEEMKRLVNRRIYPHPQAEAALIESVIIQRHGSIDKVFLSYKQEEPEELLKRCTLHQLGIDKMPSSVFEHYGILYGSENLTPSMALEGIKRAGIIDDEFKEFILFQEEQIRPEHEEKEPNEEEIARRFDCRYPVMADYVLTSNHWFYQPKKEEVPAKYSDTVFPEYTKLEL